MDIGELIPVRPTAINGQTVTAARWKRKPGGEIEVTYWRPGAGELLISTFSEVLFDQADQDRFWRWLAHCRADLSP